MTSVSVHKTTELLKLAADCREDLKWLVDVCNDYHQADDEESRVVKAWCSGLGVLAYDVSGAAIEVIGAGFRRPAKILMRSLLEYRIRLEAFRNRPSLGSKVLDALDHKRAQMFLHKDKLLGAQLGTGELTDAEMQRIRKWAEEQERPDHPSVIDLFKAADPVLGEQLYRTDYALMSTYTHGDSVIFSDVFDTTNDDVRLCWASKRYHPLVQAHTLVIYLLEMIKCVERITGRGNRHQAIKRQYRDIMDRLDLSQYIRNIQLGQAATK